MPCGSGGGGADAASQTLRRPCELCSACSPLWAGVMGWPAGCSAVADRCAYRPVRRPGRGTGGAGVWDPAGSFCCARVLVDSWSRGRVGPGASGARLASRVRAWQSVSESASVLTIPRGAILGAVQCVCTQSHRVCRAARSVLVEGCAGNRGRRGRWAVLCKDGDIRHVTAA